MLKLNSNYSDYTDETDVNYPEGKAVNASSSESYDGTPLLAEFMNDINAAHIAMYEKAYGNRTGISGIPDNQKVSQFADAVAKYTDDKVKAHTDQRGLANGVHGATSAATAGQIIARDEYGRAKVAAPVADGDIANKKWVLEAVYPVGSLYWSSKSTNPSTLFGGTWTQIKDKFVLAAGDTYKAGATGGKASITLTIANLPSHTHSFTPSGTVSAHAHGLNAHTHSFSWTGSHSHTDSGHTHSYSKKLDFGHMLGAGNASYVVGASETQSTEVGKAVISSTSITVSGTTGGNTGNTANATPTFTGSQGTTGGTGSGAAFSILPPYVVKYCWERTA